MLKKINSGIQRLTWFSEVLAEIALLGLLGLVFHEVIVRYLFDSPTIYSVEISEYLLVFIAFASVGWVLKEDRHVKMPAVIGLAPEKVRLAADIVTSVLALAFCGVLIWKGGYSAFIAYRGDYHSSSLLDFPLWIAYAVIPFGAFVMAAQYLSVIGERIAALKRLIIHPPDAEAGRS